jgi:hypothetical protein
MPTLSKAAGLNQLVQVGQLYQAPFINGSLVTTPAIRPNMPNYLTILSSIGKVNQLPYGLTRENVTQYTNVAKFESF